MIKTSTAFIVVSLLVVVNIFAADQKKGARAPQNFKEEEYQVRIKKLSSLGLLEEHESLNASICCKQLLYLLRCCYKPYQGEIKKNESKRRLLSEELYLRDPHWEHRGDFTRIC